MADKKTTTREQILKKLDPENREKFIKAEQDLEDNFSLSDMIENEVSAMLHIIGHEEGVTKAAKDKAWYHFLNFKRLLSSRSSD